MTATIKDILTTMTYATADEKALVERAFMVADKAHDGQLRKSGEPYIIHPLAIGKMLAEMGVDAATVAAGILHDTIEDTAVTSDDIKRDFGDEILFLVEGVTKLGGVRYRGTDRHNESLRRLFVATSRDIRILIIKLVDRLHNMRTLQHVAKEKQFRIAQETLQIYVPVAHRLGIGRLRKELEDLAFPYVYPDDHERVLALTREHRKHDEAMLEKCRKALQRRLGELTLTNFRTSGRVKGLYSLYQKLKRRHWDMNNVYDYLAIRVIVGSVEECYQVLGIIHELWRPMPGRIKDYIAFPKPNGYRSLHTTVATPYDRVVEIQIRTEDMHRAAELGIASHLVYKTQQNGGPNVTKNESWFRSLIPRFGKTPEVVAARPEAVTIPDWIKAVATSYTHHDVTDDDFDDALHQDFFSTRIFVFTPNNDVVDLPVNATVVDFAFEIHSDIGEHVSGARVNGKFVGIDTALKNGDRVEIETSERSHPTYKWLEFAKTSEARRKIRAYLKKAA
ncbi:hypothetical protein A3C89_01785 [Candidatus Kaiserbacteria bacterium RIFCSPHIGHO2_02_FULL_50_50]|uniref:TGS domain-containing protein n=1 Tax=Candidatus Kaiserbacteria bacterium RIFCSPHIGHO2_02_FULL_50_50 TaxID=1798492 RepID=A0A1F6DCF9_9BACT|nr:MAG: hypothetical protein A3C89_01785 [Candidatus Kaiserbacteria bacterium RIFCSPHIGHO2_02_FULL_50_50]OGG89002.1 MAG: hypothetical protein A3G62_04185 [Candidatus Kaiserbacteria bacterium RIFCSPLOWO2_12_FULL_50_10]